MNKKIKKKRTKIKLISMNNRYILIKINLDSIYHANINLYVKNIFIIRWFNNII